MPELEKRGTKQHVIFITFQAALAIPLWLKGELRGNQAEGCFLTAITPFAGCKFRLRACKLSELVREFSRLELSDAVRPSKDSSGSRHRAFGPIL